MAGTRKGGKRAAKKIRKVHGDDFWSIIGSVGGQRGRTGGFYANRELARLAGQKGGTISRRRKRVPGEVKPLPRTIVVNLPEIERIPFAVLRDFVG